MRTFVAFLVGVILGGVGVIFLPDARRDQLNTELRKQIDVLQGQVRDLGGQLKNLNLPTPNPNHASPSPSPTPQ